MTKGTSLFESSHESSHHVKFHRIPRQLEFHIFRVTEGSTGHWHVLSGSRCAMCQVGNESNKSSSGAHGRHVSPHDWVESKVDGYMDKGNPREPIG